MNKSEIEEYVRKNIGQIDTTLLEAVVDAFGIFADVFDEDPYTLNTREKVEERMLLERKNTKETINSAVEIAFELWVDIYTD